MKKENSIIMMRDEDLKTNYFVDATGIQAVISRLTGVIPPIPVDSIKFYSAWILTEDTENNKITNNNEIYKITKLVRKKRHYHYLDSIVAIYEPEGQPTWKKWVQWAYYIFLGRERSHGSVLGFLYYIAEPSYVMGIWPAENVKRYENIDKNERQNLYLADLKKFQRPKFWDGVYILLMPE